MNRKKKIKIGQKNSQWWVSGFEFCNYRVWLAYLGEGGEGVMARKLKFTKTLFLKTDPVAFIFNLHFVDSFL